MMDELGRINYQCCLLAPSIHPSNHHAIDSKNWQPRIRWLLFQGAIFRLGSKVSRTLLVSQWQWQRAIKWQTRKPSAKNSLVGGREFLVSYHHPHSRTI